MNLTDLVRYWGKTRPAQQAIVFGNTSQTWSEVDAVTDALARGLAARGVRKGDRVGVMMLNRPELAHVILATLKLGAISVPLNFRLLGKELAPMLVDSAPRVVIVENELAPLLEEAAAETEFEIFAIGGSDHRAYETLLDPGNVPDVHIEASDPAFICYTSGTTGIQKGALVTHRSALAPGIAQVLSHGISRRDRVMCSAPLVYTGSVLSIFMQLVVLPGSTMVLLREFDPAIALDTFEREQVTATTTVPVIWERMAQLPDFGTRKLAKFTFAGAGGAPVSLDLLDFYNSRGVPLTQAYGLTEASGMVSTLYYEDARTRPGFAGLALAGTQVRIGSIAGGFAAPNEVGEILVRGEHVMREYWNKPEATADTLVDGWLRTGDLGLQDEGGFLKVVDRRKDMLISGGLNVYPAEIEKALHGIDGLVDLAVIGVKDDRWGEVPMVVFHSQRPADDIVTDIACVASGNLARFKRPAVALALDEPLPRTFSGKLAKAVLRERFQTPPAHAIPVPREAQSADAATSRS
ncbi:MULTISPECIES: class I adenylate-forming enzyme family protein [Rhodococcus]|uniref:AMP-binding protein n=1 Tax=Rhodococcus aetherivorans TaxID=191292 RepID=N1M7R6_9NOCA|nr:MULTISPECIES: AMP-binding protein [Rhodococcus]ETT25959.1 o-succinylbenzoate--CoA ligase [Rhodococcus rhodochrous ATCC 21198]AKE88764.1 AMP-dependent acyl-CoA synthetase [Rhodococcus aetherivorans]ANZ26552.1 AMP-dependent acyl-CoA synthetase [Rhodococcus sp. WB1]MBC2591574.1 AMP-binding protein [Rhodococcus aetherivorans]MDV6294614.1 AMP-binding protein [Rhodococcus aetherivorans]